MDIFEISGYRTGISRAGVNYLQPADSFQNMNDGFVYRQVLQSRKGFTQFSTGKVSDGTRIMGIFEHTLRTSALELLVISKNFLYTYDGGTDTFIQIANAGSAPAGGFNITSNQEYISGTTYPFPDGSDRFVFTGPGLSDIFMYDGTDVRSFTLDNPDYANPGLGVVTNAQSLLFFGNRLLLVNPTINGSNNPQTIIFPGFADQSGNGDKYNVAGSGTLVFDTANLINYAIKLGNIAVVTFNRSVWAIEISRNDRFNPLILRKIAGVLGSDAPFSAVSWDDEIMTIGRTGVIGTDGRDSYRVDNKIPDTAPLEFDQQDINLTYGGFDRINGQFLFSYKQLGSESTTQDKVLVNNYEEGTWSFNDQRFSVFGETDLGQFIPWNDIDSATHPEFPTWSQWDTTTEIWNQIGLDEFKQKTLAGDDEGFVYQLNTDLNDYASSITAITNASQAVLTTQEQAFKAGDRVGVYGVEGMVEINNFDPQNPNVQYTPWTVVSSTDTTITLDAVSTEFGTYTQGGVIAKLINFSAEMVPFNPYRDSGRMVYVSHIEFLIDTNGGNLKVSIFSDEETSPIKQAVLCQPNTILKARQWITVSVNNESNFITFKLEQESLSSQVKVTAVRIHCRPGALTSA